MLPSFFRDTITVLMPEQVEKNGKPVLDYTKLSRMDVGGCNVQPSTTDRDHDGRQVSVSDEMTVYAPASATIEPQDLIEWQGDRYQIEGMPQKWRSPSGRLTHQQIRIKRWRG